jgi:hypothetical protein
MTKVGTQSVSGGLLEPTKVGFVTIAEDFSPTGSALTA